MNDFSKHIADIVESGQQIVWICTTEEDRAVEFVRLASKSVGARMLDWTSAALFKDEPTPKAMIETLKRFNSKIYVVIRDAHILFQQDILAVRRLKDILPHLVEFGIGLFLISPVDSLPVELSEVAAEERLPMPKASDLLQMFTDTASMLNVNVDEEFLQSAAYLGAGLSSLEAVSAFKRALLAFQRFPNNRHVALNLFLKAKAKRLKSVASLDVIESTVSMDDLGGLGELKKWLLMRRDAFGNRAKSFGLPTPRGLLMLGVQGCGKSMASKAIGSMFRFPVVRLDIGALFSFGSAADERMRDALLRCEALAPVVLWIDEVEKGFAGSDGENSESTRLLGMFLSWMQEHTAPVFVVATANNIRLLPPEFVRRGRFDEIFFVDLPSEDERKEIFRIHLQKRNRNADEFEIDRLAKLSSNFSGAEIEQVVIAALYRAFAENRELSNDDLLRETENLIPLYRVQEESVKQLREWAETRARNASSNRSVLKYFK